MKYVVLLISVHYNKLENDTVADFSPKEVHDRVDSCRFTVASEEPASSISSFFPRDLKPLFT